MSEGTGDNKTAEFDKKDLGADNNNNEEAAGDAGLNDESPAVDNSRGAIPKQQNAANINNEQQQNNVDAVANNSTLAVEQQPKVIRPQFVPNLKTVNDSAQISSHQFKPATPVFQPRQMPPQSTTFNNPDRVPIFQPRRNMIWTLNNNLVSMNNNNNNNNYRNFPNNMQQQQQHQQPQIQHQNNNFPNNFRNNFRTPRAGAGAGGSFVPGGGIPPTMQNNNFNNNNPATFYNVPSPGRNSYENYSNNQNNCMMPSNAGGGGGGGGSARYMNDSPKPQHFQHRAPSYVDPNKMNNYYRPPIQYFPQQAPPANAVNYSYVPINQQNHQPQWNGNANVPSYPYMINQNAPIMPPNAVPATNNTYNYANPPPPPPLLNSVGGDAKISMGKVPEWNKVSAVVDDGNQNRIPDIEADNNAPPTAEIVQNNGCDDGGNGIPNQGIIKITKPWFNDAHNIDVPGGSGGGLLLSPSGVTNAAVGGSIGGEMMMEQRNNQRGFQPRGGRFLGRGGGRGGSRGGMNRNGAGMGGENRRAPGGGDRTGGGGGGRGFGNSQRGGYTGNNSFRSNAGGGGGGGAGAAAGSGGMGGGGIYRSSNIQSNPNREVSGGDSYRSNSYRGGRGGNGNNRGTRGINGYINNRGGYSGRGGGNARGNNNNNRGGGMRRGGGAGEGGLGRSAAGGGNNFRGNQNMNENQQQ